MTLGIANLIIGALCFFIAGLTSALSYLTIKEGHAGLASLNTGIAVVNIFVGLYSMALV